MRRDSRRSDSRPTSISGLRSVTGTFAESMTRILPTLFLVVSLSACSRSGSTATGGIITDRGTFPSPSGSYQLVIGSKPESLVDYRIVNVATKKEFTPDRQFSDAMRWAAFWQDDDTLWVHSSDIGLSVWKRNSQGVFSQEWLGERSELVRTIPKELWSVLPSTLKRRWEPLRKQNSEPDGPANGSQPIRSETNSTSSAVAPASGLWPDKPAAGSRR